MVQMYEGLIEFIEQTLFGLIAKVLSQPIPILPCRIRRYQMDGKDVLGQINSQ
jgi:hypothetical protein